MQGAKKNKNDGGNKTTSPLTDLTTIWMQKNHLSPHRSNEHKNAEKLTSLYHALGKMQCAGVGDPPHMIYGESHRLIQVPKVNDGH